MSDQELDDDDIRGVDDDAQLLTPINLNNEDGDKTPNRALSSQSLLGESIVQSSLQGEIDNSELSDSSMEASFMTTPPHGPALPVSLSPPLLAIDPPISQEFPDAPPQTANSTSSGKLFPKPRRPPRVPQVFLPPHRNAGDHRSHGRVQSNTDYSFLSALTDTSSDFEVFHHQQPPSFGPKPHRRTVSWDMNVTSSHSPGAASHNSTPAGTPASILQPILFDYMRDPSPAPPQNIVTTPHIQPPVHEKPSNLSLYLKDAETLTKIMQPKEQPEVEEKSAKKPETCDGIDQPAALNPTTPPKTFSKHEEYLSPPKQYSLREVKDALHETDAEAQVMDTLEAQTINVSYSSSSILFPSILDSRVHDFEEDNLEDENTRKPSEGTRQHSNASTELKDLTKLLVAAQGATSRSTITAKLPSEKAAEKMAATASVLFADRSTSLNSKKSSKNDIELGGKSDDDESAEGQKIRGSSQGGSNSPKNVKSRIPNFNQAFRRAQRRIKEDTEYFLDFIEPKKASLWNFWMTRFKLLVLPSILLALIFFYAVGNPPTGKSNSVSGIFPIQYSAEHRLSNKNDSAASTSWWILFIGARQVITLCLACTLEVLIIDFLVLRTRFFTSWCGPYISLFIAQSRGWPFRLFMWSLMDIILLYGNNRFVKHWLYWQGFIDLMNENNPCGNVTNNNFYHRILYVGLGFGAAATAKRVVLGQLVGKRLVGEVKSVRFFAAFWISHLTFFLLNGCACRCEVNYSKDLSKVMKNLILVTEIGYLAQEVDEAKARNLVHRHAQRLGVSLVGQETLSPATRVSSASLDHLLDTRNENDRKTNFNSSSELLAEISEMLGDWEEPELEQNLRQVCQLKRAPRLTTSRFVHLLLPFSKERRNHSICPSFQACSFLY